MGSELIAVEREILCAILVNSNALRAIAGTIESWDFKLPAHRVIFDALKRLIDAAESTDSMLVEPVTREVLRRDLERTGDLDRVGGATYIAGLVDHIPDVSDVKRLAGLLRADRSH